MNRNRIFLLLTTCILTLHCATDKHYQDAAKRFDAALKTATDAATAKRTATALQEYNNAQIALCDLTGYWHEDKKSTRGISLAQKMLNTKFVPDVLHAKREQLNNLLKNIAGLDVTRLDELATSIRDHVNAISNAALDAAGVVGPMTTAPTSLEKKRLTNDTTQISNHRTGLVNDLNELTEM